MSSEPEKKDTPRTPEEIEALKSAMQDSLRYFKDRAQQAGLDPVYAVMVSHTKLGVNLSDDGIGMDGLTALELRIESIVVHILGMARVLQVNMEMFLTLLVSLVVKNSAEQPEDIYVEDSSSWDKPDN
jgi:hypothetical protein